MRKADELRIAAARETVLATVQAMDHVASRHHIRAWTRSEDITRERAFALAEEIGELHDLLVESARQLPGERLVQLEIVVGDEPADDAAEAAQ